MNFRTTLLLLVLVVAVGITIFFVTRHDEQTRTPDKEKTDEHRLVDYESNDVTRVAVTNYDGNHVVLEKSGSDWKLVEPVAARAKTFEVDDLVRALVGLKSRGELEASKKTSGGLDHPSFVVEMTTKAGKTTKLSFGDNSAVGDSLYVLVDDAAKPNIISNGIYATLDKPASNYRDTKLVNTPSSDIKQLAITQKGQTIKLEKKGEKWEITEPAKIPAEFSAVSDLLSGITGLDATEFIDKPSTTVKNSLVDPRISVAFSTKAPPAQPTTQSSGEAALPGGEVIRFGGYQGVMKKGVYASLNGKEVAVVPATSVQTFEKTPLDLRDRDVVEIVPDRVSKFTVAISKPPTTQPILGPALPPGLTPATAPTTHPATEPSAPADVHEFTIERHKPEVPATTESAATTRPAVATTQPAEATTRPIATTQPSESATQSAVATTEPATKPSEIAAAKWIFTSGGSGPAEEGQVTDLLADLHPLRAEKYLDTAKEPGATYTLTVHVIPATAADSAEDFVLTFVDTGGRVDGFYKDLHFTVNRSLVEKLNGDFKTRKAAPPEPPPSQFPGGHGGLPFGG